MPEAAPRERPTSSAWGEDETVGKVTASVSADRTGTWLNRATCTSPSTLRCGSARSSCRPGAGAADVTATMLAVTRACGVRDVSADVTFVDLSLHHQPAVDQPAAVRMRRVTQRQVDYGDLTEVDQTVADLVEGRITREEARDQVARIVSTGPLRRRWVVTLGWGVMGTGVALTLGGGVVVCVLAFLAACAIDRTKKLLSRFRIPSFYEQAAGGFVATLIAVSAAATSWR